jgi:dUTP pyrophosphatase
MKKVKLKLEPGATAPIKATDGSVGYDLFVYGSHCIYPGRNAVRTGLSIQLPEGFEATVRPRSGCSLKGIPDEYNLRHNADALLGTIDTDYRGEIKMIVVNHEDEEFFLSDGQRIAQLVISPVFTGVAEVVDELDDTERGEGGFNSTGL